MTEINSVTLLGRLTRDCEVKTFNNGGNVINFDIAVNRSVKKGDEWVDEANFFAIRYSTKSTKIAEYLKKGTQVVINGYLKQEKWEKDGKQNSKIVVVATTLNLCSGGKAKQDIPQEAKAVADAFGGEAFPDDVPF